LIKCHSTFWPPLLLFYWNGSDETFCNSIFCDKKCTRFYSILSERLFACALTKILKIALPIRNDLFLFHFILFIYSCDDSFHMHCQYEMCTCKTEAVNKQIYSRLHFAIYLEISFIVIRDIFGTYDPMLQWLNSFKYLKLLL
jgi:hypothetical protein